MRTKAVILNLRVARPSDFADSLGEKKFGCMYFQQSITGTFCNQPYFFHENTDMEVFKELYSTNQIWVLAGIFDEVEIIDKRKPILKNGKIKKTYCTSGRNRFRDDRSNRPCTCKKNR
jgi:hypothetical protein